MGAMWISVIVTLLQIQALTSVNITTGVEGQKCSFRCEYPARFQSNLKFLWRVSDSTSNSPITTNTPNQWVNAGHFSLYDNTTGSFLNVRVDRLMQQDKGVYWCGVDVSSLPDYVTVIQLNVVPAEDRKKLSHFIPTTSISPTDSDVDPVNKPLFLTAVMCVGAMLFVCLFSLCLLLTVKNRRSGPRHNRQTSADYETMMPRVGAEPVDCCTCPNCEGLPTLSPPPPQEICSECKIKQRESTVMLGIGDYVDVDVLGRQYQHLDLSQLEENVYHSLHGNPDPKEENPLEVKEPLNC